MTDGCVMDQSEDLAFMRYPRPIPKRYEETRSAIIQDFTHRRIICYGSEIQKKVKEKQEEEKKNVARKSEEEIWQQAGIIKEAELNKLREQLKVEHDKHIKKIMKENEQALKEEALKVEMQMQKLTIQQVKKERLKGEEALARAVQEAEEVAAKQLQEACAAVERRERETAEEFVANLIEKHTREIEQLKEMASEDKQNAIARLTETKDREKEAAVQAARRQEQETAARSLANCQERYENKLRQLEERLAEREEQIGLLNEELARSEFLRRAVEQRLLEVRLDYQKHIERTSGLTREQTDLFMPAIYLDQVEQEALQQYEKQQHGQASGQSTDRGGQNADTDRSQNADLSGDLEQLQEDTDTTGQ